MSSFVCVCGLLLTGATGPQGSRAHTLPERIVWDVIRAQDGDFAFSMPAPPRRELRQPDDTTRTLEVLSYSCGFEGSDYRLQRVESSQAIAPEGVVAALDALQRRDFLKDSTELLHETSLVVDGVIGADLTYTEPVPAGADVVTRRTRHFINGQYYYVLTVSSPPGKPLPDAAGRFLSSLTFEAVVRAHRARSQAESASPAPVPNPPPVSDRGHETTTFRDPAPPPAGAPAGKIRIPLVDSTPEDALKTFLLALAAQDEGTLRAVSMPDPEFAWLLRGTAASAATLVPMKRKLERISMPHLKVGDTARLTDGRTRVLQPADVREGRVVLWPEGSPYAVGVEQTDGHWKVFARPFIAARQALEARSSPEHAPRASSLSGPAP